MTIVPERDADWVLRGQRRPDLLRDETLADIFETTAAAAPGRPALALLGAAEAMTYAGLEAASGRVAAALAARGVRRGDRVGVWMRRSTELHVAILGILRAGAAYIPFDAEAPADRVGRCLADCGASLIVTHRDLGAAPASLTAAEVLDVADLLAHAPSGGKTERAGPDDPAYIIYTSGSTGEPKGILVAHRNVCHYVRSINETLGVNADDVVLQQASVAFDLSVEEIFVPYLVGALVRVAPEAALRAVDTLADALERDQISVIDTVPTLLALFERRPASLRLVITGGEACPDAIVARWTGEGCRLVNTYGPTETTVVATAIDLVPGEPVTIGRPIANYTAYVLDENLAPVPRGQQGELVIGGPGVAQGYVQRPDLTAQKFVANPHAEMAASEPIVYRTGDAVSVDDAGRLAFHGRIDAQVKIRGFRIELGEIEALIAREPGVKAATVTASKHMGGDILVAHVVADDAFDKEATRKSLASRLPPYMVPTAWRPHADLPRLASGKVDRKALAALPVADVLAAAAGEQEAPSSVTEAHLLKAAREALGLPVVPLDGDFFLDLGGNSLVAARFVSEVRKVPHLAGVAMQDVYAARSLRKLAGVLDERARENAAAGTERTDLSFTPPPLWRRFLCGLGQLIALPFIIAIVTAQWIALLLASIYLVRDDNSLAYEIAVLCLIFVAINLGAKVLVVALKWIVIGRTKPGVYPLWGFYYYRLWLMQRCVHLTAPKFLQGSPLMRVYLMALGAKVGRDAIIYEFEDGATDLIEIGPRATIGTKVRFANVEVIGNEVHVGRIVVGADAYIGNACVLGRNSVVGDGAELGDITAIAAGTVVPAGHKWDGARGRPAGRVEVDLPPHPTIGPVRRVWHGVRYFVTFNLGLMAGLLPIFPAFYLLTYLDGVMFGDRDNVVPWHWVFALAWPSALALVFASMAIVIVLRWVLLPRRVSAGRHSIHSGFYYRKWTIGLVTEAMLETLNSLYATVFMRNWYRLMGTKVGPGTEISSNFSGRYDLIELGSNNFLGDEAIIGDEEVRGGWMTLERVKTGDRVFTGNLAVIGPGSVIGDDALIGVKSRMPDSLNVRAGETWFGSPAIAIPNRERVALAAGKTYRPPFRMRLWRIIFEAMHTSFPTAVLISVAYIMADIIQVPMDLGNYGQALGILFVAGIVVSMVMLLVSVAVKWLFMGIYRPMQRPMWSWWAMRTEAVSVLYGGLASKVMLDYVRGTPFMPMLLRLYGIRIGKGVWINCSDITEFDCISIGDYSVINMLASPQTHLYEDRVMKVGRIDIGKGVTLGTASIILYDTRIGDFARIEPLTVVMKGEHIPAHTAWAGAPAERVPVPAEPQRITQEVPLPASSAAPATPRAASLA